VQPLIEPLYGGKSAHEIIAILSGQTGVSGHDLVQGYWQKQHTGDFDIFWRRALHDGLIAGTTYQPKNVAAKGANVRQAKRRRTASAIELNFRRDPSIYDGRFANNGWLQELPKPLTR
jgi:molybdopterin-containing oxidoreductase family iron-sulfur binding subunit